MRLFKLLLLSVIMLMTTSIVSFKKINGYDTIDYKPWAQSGSGYWSHNGSYSIYNDFDYKVTRSKYKINGYYYYDFWFYSQSYYSNGRNVQYTSTNIRNFYVFNYDNNLIVKDVTTLGITFLDTYNAPTLRFISTNPNVTFWFKWELMNAK